MTNLDLLSDATSSAANSSALASHQSRHLAQHGRLAYHSSTTQPSRSRSSTISAHSSINGSPRYPEDNLEPRRSRSKSRNHSRISIHNNSQDNPLLQAAISKHFQSRYAAPDGATSEINESSHTSNLRSSIISGGDSKLTRSVSSNSFLALQNQGQISQRNKNIPMKPQNNILNSNSTSNVNSRPSMKRWKTFSIDNFSAEQSAATASNKDTVIYSQSKVENDCAFSDKSLLEKEIHDSSVSPLTVLKNNHEIKQPPNLDDQRQRTIPLPPTTDNSFSELASSQSDKPTNHRNGSTDTPSTTVTSTTNKIYDKVSHLVNYAHSGLNSLVSSHVRQAALDSTGESGIDANDGISSTRKSLRYESESDDDDAEADEIDTNVDNSYHGHNDTYSKPSGWHKPHDIVTSPYVDASVSDLTNFSSVNINDMVRDINDFQDSFVKKMITPSPSNESSTMVGEKHNNISRIQQKILDYRDLYSEEELSNKLKPKSSFNSLSLNGTTNEKRVFESSLDYSIKIQHDTIMSEYTQIRLRFTSASPSSKSNTPQAGMTSHMGVLGFVNRTAYVNSLKSQITTRKSAKSVAENDPWKVRASSAYASPDFQHPITFDSKDDYLKSMWDTEMQSTFNTTISMPDYTPSNSSFFSEPSNSSKSSSGMQLSQDMSLDGHRNPTKLSNSSSRTKKGSYDASDQNFANIARNVKLET